MTILHTLVLWNNELRYEAIEVLEPNIPSGLVQLALGQNHTLGPDGAIVLAPLLERLTNLEYLSLPMCFFETEGGKALAAPFQHLTALRYLDLRDNFCTGANGFVALAPSLQHMTALEKLHLDENNFKDEGAKALAPSLLLLTRLQELNIAFNYIGEDGIRALQPSLQQLTCLTSLDLGGNELGQLGTAGITAIAKAVFPRLPRLAKLMLDCNSLGSACGRALAAQLEYRTGLQTLSLSSNSLSDAAELLIQKKLSHIPGLELGEDEDHSDQEGQ